MITIDIPGREPLGLEFAVFDFNGTLAIDGELISGVKERLNKLSERIEIHVLTADTFGKARVQLQNASCKLMIIDGVNQKDKKADYISKLGVEKVIAFGNGLNDAKLLKNAGLGIGVIQKEGICIQSLNNADIVCTNILDAIDLLFNPLRITATLRD